MGRSLNYALSLSLFLIVAGGACKSAPPATPVAGTAADAKVASPKGYSPTAISRLGKHVKVAQLTSASAPAGTHGKKVVALMAAHKSTADDGVPPYGPVLLVGKKQGIDLRSEFAGYEWTHLIRGKYAIASLDYTVEGLAWEVPIFLSDAKHEQWQRFNFKKPHFSGAIESLMVTETAGTPNVALRLAISRGVVPGLAVSYSDPKSDQDYLDYEWNAEAQTWKFSALPLKFLPEDAAISESTRSSALEKLKLKLKRGVRRKR